MKKLLVAIAVAITSIIGAFIGLSILSYLMIPPEDDYFL